MQNKTIEFANDITDFHMSQMTFKQSWDDTGISVVSAASLSSEDELGFDYHLRSVCETISDTIALLNSPLDETEEDLSPLPSKLATMEPFDSPPCRPRRSFDAGALKHGQLSRSVSDLGHDRFQLTRSEHISRSFRAPKCPSRPTDGELDSVSGGCSRPSLGDAQYSCRDVMMRRPSRTQSKKIDLRRDVSPEENNEGKVTLRASGNQILLGSRESATSEYLRRSCPNTK